MPRRQLSLFPHWHKPAPPAPTRLITMASLPDRETPLRILGDESGAIYSLHSVQECGAEFQFALILPYAQRHDPMAERRVIALQRLAVAG